MMFLNIFNPRKSLVKTWSLGGSKLLLTALTANVHLISTKPVAWIRFLPLRFTGLVSALLPHTAFGISNPRNKSGVSHFSSL